MGFFPPLISAALLHSPDIICVSETWLCPEVLSSELFIPRYSLFRLDRSRHGGGVAIYAKSCLQPSVFQLPPHSLELLTVTIRVHSQCFHVSSFYRPPTSINDLINTLSSLGPGFTSKTILVGDFNVNVGNSQAPLFHQVSSLTSIFSLNQIVSQPTHFSPSGSPSIIDLVFVPQYVQGFSIVSPPLGSSDHSTILSSLSFLPKSPPLRRQSRRKVWLYHKADFNAINKSLSVIDWTSTLPQNLDSACSKFSSIFLQTVHDHVPSKIVTDQPLPPWLSRPLLCKIQRRRRLFHQAVTSKSPTLYSDYRSLRNSICAEVKRSKSQFFTSISHSPQKFWSYVRSLRRCKDSVPPLTSSSGSLVSKDSDKANLLNQAFSSFFTIDPASPAIAPLDPSLVCCEDLLCTVDSVSKLISSLPTCTSPGPDGIPSLLLKSTACSITEPLKHIFNLSISTGSFPSPWKISCVIPIPKTSPPSSAPTDFRPISLLNLISKLLEKHIFNILLDHLFSNNLLSDSQFGFLPGRSTISALAACSQHILSTFDAGSSLCGIFLDVKKAFDSVSHSILLSKLQSLGIPSHILHWLFSYLSDRSQCVRIGNAISPPSPVSSGVPQGSILGPLLFVTFVNDLNLLPLSSNSKVFLYADDLLLLHTLSPNSNVSPVQSDLDLITSWFYSNRLSVNPSKSKYMFFSLKHQQSFDSLPSLLLSNIPFERVYSFKYLGLILSCNLSWSKHITCIIKRAKRLIGLIYRQFYSLSSPKTLLSLYTTIVRPILEYESPIWDPSSVSLSSSIDSVQYFALKMISKSWSTPYSALLSSLNLSTLDHRRKRSKLLFFYKINNGLTHSTLPLTPHPPSPPMSLRHFCPYNYTVPFCRTSCYCLSFLPSTIRLWNSLPSNIKQTTSISYLKFYLDCKF